MKFYFKLAQEAPQQEASYEEIQQVLTSFSNDNSAEMQKFLMSKKIDPYYHNWFMDAILDLDYLESVTVDYAQGPETKYKTIAKYPKNIFDLFNVFIKTQNPNQAAINSFLNQSVDWENPDTQQRERITRKQALENVNV